MTHYQYKLADRVILLTEENHEHSEEHDSNSNHLSKQLHCFALIHDFDILHFFQIDADPIKSYYDSAGILLVAEEYSPPELV